MKLFNIIICLFITTISISQTKLSLEDLSSKEDVITISLKKHIYISNKRGNLKITEIVNKRNFFVTDQQLSFASESINYDTFNTIESLEAYTINPTEKKKKKIVTKFVDKNVLIRGIFFNDQKEKTFTYPNIKKGSYTNLNYTRNIKDPHFIPAFIIGQNIPILSGKFSITYPESIKINYKTYNLDSINSSFNKIVKNGQTTLEWTLREVPKINRHYDLSPLHYIPQIFIYIASYETPKETVKVLSNVKDLYKWYNKLISKTRTSHEDLENITKNLIKNASSEIEKIERIYYFVQNQINYIAFEDGLNGFIPRDAMEVYNKKYGDCKDMANILNEMLNYANIESYITWIGTRQKPYTYKELPTPFTDNHMITCAIVDDKHIFLDATAKYLTYGLPSPFIQGKEALVSNGEESFTIKKVPEVKPLENKSTYNSVFSLDEEKLNLIGKHNVTLSGYEKLNLLHKLERKGDDDLDFLYTALDFGTKRTTFKNIIYDSLDIKHKVLSIHFNTENKDRIKKIGNSLYIKPNLDFSLKTELVKNEAKSFHKKIEYKFVKHFNTSIKIPKNFSLKSLPKNKAYKNNLFSFSTEFNLSNDGLVFNIKEIITVNTLLIKPENIDAWNTFVSLINKESKRNIILEKI